MSGYRNKSCPLPFFALDNSLVRSLHVEIRALHALLLASAAEQGVPQETTEFAIDGMVKMIKVRDAVKVQEEADRD